MATRFFGQYLLERNIITREMLLDAVKYQREINLPLCALAIEKGCLTKEQLRELDDAHKGSDKKFIELALRRKMLSYEQLSELSKERSERWVFFGEALVQKGYLSLERFEELLREYRAQRGAQAAPAESVLDGVPERELISSMLRITIDLFLHYTKQIIKVISVKVGYAEPDEAVYVFSQKITGDKPVQYALAVPEGLTLAIARHILQEDRTEVDELTLDAVEEFVNVVIGNACATLDMKECKASAEPPQILTRQMLADLASSTETVTVTMETMKGRFNALFLLRGGSK